MKKGLILEGGAMRGMFSAGVMDVMMENGIEYDGAIGVSAGALFGCNYKSKQIGRSFRYNLRYCKDRRFIGLYALITDGNIVSKNFAYGEVPLKYDKFDIEAYKNNPMEFWVVTTDIETGEAFYQRCDSFDDHGFDWFRASGSLPIVSQIVEIDGKKYLDGSIADSVPLEFFESRGYDRNVAVLTQPRGYRKDSGDNNALIRHMYKEYPKFLDTLDRRPQVYNEQRDLLESREDEGRLFVIAPKEPLKIKRLDRDMEAIVEAYHLGRDATLDRLDELKEFLRD